MTHWKPLPSEPAEFSEFMERQGPLLDLSMVSEEAARALRAYALLSWCDGFGAAVAHLRAGMAIGQAKGH